MDDNSIRERHGVFTPSEFLRAFPVLDHERQPSIDALHAEFLDHGLATFIARTNQFGYTRRHGARLPRPADWRPYRFAVQDIILACTTIRHSRVHNCIEVDVFLTGEPHYQPADRTPEGQTPYPFEALASAKALTLMLLSEAFRCGTSMRLRFTSNVERTAREREAGVTVGRVPHAILRLASSAGIRVDDPESGVLADGVGRALYAALTGFSSGLAERMRELTSGGLSSVERACYLVHHGVWTVPELEGIIRGCPYPDVVLDGEIQPEQRHLYHLAQVHARTALLGGALDRALRARQPEYTGDVPNHPKHVKGRAQGAAAALDNVAGSPVVPGLDIEDDDRDLIIAFDAELTARRYRLGPHEQEPLPLPDWQPFAGPDGETRSPNRISHGDELIALLRPRDESGLMSHLRADIAAAAGAKAPATHVAVIVPMDFNDLRADMQEVYCKEAMAQGVSLLVYPENARTLDAYAREKLSRSRVLPE